MLQPWRPGLLFPLWGSRRISGVGRVDRSPPFRPHSPHVRPDVLQTRWGRSARELAPSSLVKTRAARAQIFVEWLVLSNGSAVFRESGAIGMPMPEVVLALTQGGSAKFRHDADLTGANGSERSSEPEARNECGRSPLSSGPRKLNIDQD